MAKRINFSPYEKQILLACVKEYANIIEDKRTDKRTTKEKENAWEALVNKFNADAGVTKRSRKQLESCWKNLKAKHKTQEASDRREHFRTGGGPAPPTTPEDPITQAIGDILQRRFDPLPNPYDDDADKSAHDTDDDKGNDNNQGIMPSRGIMSVCQSKTKEEATASVKPRSSSTTRCEKLPVAKHDPCGVPSEDQQQSHQEPFPFAKQGPSGSRNDVTAATSEKTAAAEQVPPVLKFRSGSCANKRKALVVRRKVNSGEEVVGDQILKYRHAEHLERMKTIRLERKFMVLEHNKKMELLKLKIANEKAHSKKKLQTKRLIPRLRHLRNLCHHSPSALQQGKCMLLWTEISCWTKELSVVSENSFKIYLMNL